MRCRGPRCRRSDRRTCPRAPSAHRPARLQRRRRCAGRLPRRRPGADRAGRCASTTSARSGRFSPSCRASPMDRTSSTSSRSRARWRWARTPRRSTHSSRSRARSVPSLAPRGISVHTINPGFVETPGFPQRGRLPRAVLPFVAATERSSSRRILARGRPRPARDRRAALVPRPQPGRKRSRPALIASARARTSRRRPRSRLGARCRACSRSAPVAAGEIEVRLEVALLANDVLAYEAPGCSHRRAHAGRRRRARVLSTGRAPARSVLSSSAASGSTGASWSTTSNRPTRARDTHELGDRSARAAVCDAACAA